MRRDKKSLLRLLRVALADHCGSLVFLRTTEPPVTSVHGRQRVLVGVCEIAGYYRSLAEGMRQLGVDCVALNLAADPFGYGVDPALPRWVQSCVAVHGRRREAPASDHFRRAGHTASALGVRLVLCIWAACRFDVFIFGFDSSFFRLAELPVLKLLGKRLIFCFHGSDARPAYLDGSIMAKDRGWNVHDCAAKSRRTKRIVRWIDRYADVIISHGPYAQFHGRPFVGFLDIGIPVVAVADAVDTTDQSSGVVRVVHAASHPDAKGTAEIRRIVDRLKAKGYAIDFIALSGVSNSVVKAALARADLVIDQLYSDTPMAGLVAEAAAVGCPSVVGGYEAAEISAEIPADSMPPSRFCHPDLVEAEAERLIAGCEARRQLGEAARTFVTTRWAPAEVAARFMQVVRGDIPSHWWHFPGETTYLRGCCLTEERRHALLRELVVQHGRSALNLDEKPDLRAALLVEAGLEAG